MSANRPPTVDPVAAERWQRIAPAAAPWLHEEVARRMLERLQWIKLQPRAWLHWGALRGGLQAQWAIAAAYPAAKCFVVESQTEHAHVVMKITAIPWWNPRRWLAPAVVFQAPQAASMDMLWANMALHESADPQALLVQWHQALRVGGFVMFSCLGPDSARELREIYQVLGWPPASHQLTDMHDWGDMLVQTGFSEPVMDMERITLTYETPERLLQELRELGRNYHPERFGALRGRGWKKQLLQVLAQRLPRQADGRLALTFEVIYGHALKAQPKVRVSARSAVSEQDMRAMLQGARSRP
ncbi:biotin synthase [Polaromonas sp.]|uniref:biotin synthase n=1 Tax=Polaromonas sp. TaxID=1869339 RepID=UPI00272F9697|nr:biotin synthase [Polaromonas sp.]MDP1743026.1 biotin synthase [Polaromonas sp.]